MTEGCNFESILSDIQERKSSSSSVVSLMDDTIPIPFPFPLLDNDDADLNERIAFWDSPSTINWFRQRGYTLYVRNEFADQPWYSEPALGCKHPSEMQYPYPYYGSEENSKTPLRALDLSATCQQGKIAYAQEIHDPSHHVAIKLIVTDSEEHRILYFLHSQGMEVLKENCLIPVLNILSNGSFSFVVMPRQMERCGLLPRERTDPKCHSHYAFFAQDTDRARCRLSYKLAWDGSGYQPHDTMQGEIDYNPFAYDVGMLGRVLCMRFQHLAPQIPMLAPFLDKMVTRNIPLRFNAAQALQFFEAFLPEISEEVLNSVYHEKTKASDYEWDRWEGLPPDFIKKWESYREPPVPFSTIVLRWIFSFERMPYILPVVRLWFFRITLIPSRIGVFLRNLWRLAFPS
ncbi:hypothetical protein AGABI1DRAFT_108013 [Agaricus bisporus var. burnettii JB137-S8]|uniref:Uncharacterized protein n=1 Tax=Agaricus bisporus var. burnettii (strain JB137-S8 / ATCC MYA-4627 / FGSC 10392) TaxID=597362 RepID=K5X3H4_AGABU|nr:uncharacterized protein AGABI1DRAFT_108013 [Agaricus bisporus var. burnettii JB137-S8]EKM77482.1 hypothetical protein AGABI1DRAFT_108013 [Agaricus bisporus var. burnettii JB137-S8]